MSIEIPILLRCCFCFPLRRGLLAWAYVKQVFSTIFLVVMITEIIADFSRLFTVDQVIYVFVTTYLAIDIVFHVLFIISAHKKAYRTMRVFYRYGVAVLCVACVLFGLQLYVVSYDVTNALRDHSVQYVVTEMLPTSAMSLTFILSEVYFILLVRSEFIKLKNNSQLEFTNHGPEEACTANLDVAADLPDIA